MSDTVNSGGRKRKSGGDDGSSKRKQKKTVGFGRGNDESVTSDKGSKIVTDLNVKGFAESRAAEIQALTEVVKNVGGNHMAFQKLPRHMRRRAMSHNIKRVPKRLHSAVKSELEKTKAPGKRPSRRYRRRPSNLLAEYERRKRRIGWLETHIWHAKRFKMMEKWSYRLAMHPSDKSVRACYRAVNWHCLMQDVSFESYIEITGKRATIIEGLSHLTSEKTGPTFAAKMTSMGTRQGKLMLYSYDCYPYKAIGQVTYLWRPLSSNPKITDQNIPSALWICCHPSFYSQVLREINACFEKILDTKSDVKQNVVVVPLKDHLVKFRLYGPASNQVLAESLKLADICVENSHPFAHDNKAFEKAENEQESREFKTNLSERGTIDVVSSESKKSSEVDSKNVDQWWKNYYTHDKNVQCFKSQSDVWSRLIQCYSPAEAPPSCVLSLTVRDPRLLLPPMRNKVSTINKGTVTCSLPLELFTCEVADSPLWEARIRENVKVTKISEQTLNNMRSKLLIPGSSLQLGEKESCIPVILIQRPGNTSSSLSSSSSSHLGYGSGWDIIIPSGWAMAFWIALVYRGARVGGIREARSIALQEGSLYEPYDFPDSLAGSQALHTESDALQIKHDRRPPAKRPNYTKMGFPSPFGFEFGKLVHEWSQKVIELVDKLSESSAAQVQMKTGNGDLCVLRDRKMLRLLNTALTDTRTFQKSKDRKKEKGNSAGSVLEKMVFSDIGKEMVEQFSTSLVPVRLITLHRGMPAMFGHVCLPSEADLKQLGRDKNYGGPQEQKHRDPYKAQRKEERKERLKLRRKKKRGKGGKIEGKMADSSAVRLNALEKAVSETTQGISEKDITAAAERKAVADVNAGVTDKSLPEIKLLTHTSRSIIGFVHSGHFDLGMGQGSGLGFCSVAALLHLLEQQRDGRAGVVLVRNPTTFQYRFARISIVL